MERYRARVDESLNAWFAREILAHEAALVRYLTRTWPNRDEVPDLRQEIYVRIYEAARKARPTYAKSFLFTTARHLMTDKARHARVVSIEAAGDLDVLNVLVDELSPERRLDGRQELKRLAQAFRLLPPRCREVVWLRRVDEMSQKEVAEQLGISVKTVESHLVKGMRLVADALFGHSSEPSKESPSSANSNESQHGQDQSD
jgi:RNA polymerase sigma factor (sigma-70 family)